MSDHFDALMRTAAQEEALLLHEAKRLSQHAVQRVIRDLEPRLRSLRADALTGLAGQLSGAIAEIGDTWPQMQDDPDILEELRVMRERLDTITAVLAARTTTLH